MAKQIVDIGAANDPTTGDSLRAGAQKINANFTELYDAGEGLGEANTIDSEPIDNEVQVLQVVSITQANYDLITPVATTFYIITT